MEAKLNGSSPNKRTKPQIVGLLTNNILQYNRLVSIALASLLAMNAFGAMAQGSGVTLFGDIKVDESKADTKAPLSMTIIIYNLAGNVIGRQSVPSGGRYRFNNLRTGEYDIAVEIETSEIARLRILVSGTPGSDFRQDLEFEWKPTTSGVKNKPTTVSAKDLYKRSSANESIFRKAQGAVDKKKYSEAVRHFRQLLDSDVGDFQAWTELGTTYLLQGKHEEAEKAYSRAIDIRPTFILALVNLGRLLVLQKKFEAAAEPLLRAVELQPTSAETNFLLGDAYLQSKKGSKAVGYLNEAAKLGKAEAHLRLAALYNAAGLKDRAAIEYEEFLKKQPDYSERKKLEQYISANKKKRIEAH
ncbi:MAG: tetratricopeptide repeat protein [Pyrinomonadaceae bacterium]